MSDSKIISIGWDVGGWLGNKNAVAALKYEGGNFEWIDLPKTFEIKDNPLSLDEFIKLAGIEEIRPDYKYIIAIDASLGLPSAYVDLIKNLEIGSIYKSNTKRKEINNLFAYRETERVIYEKFNKKPLSATFDKLGNNFIVAMTHLKTWGDEIIIHPQQNKASEENKFDVIEVYPGVLKENTNQKWDENLKKTLNLYLDEIQKLLLQLKSEEINNAFKYYLNNKEEEKTKETFKTDELDACICAILGMAFKNPSDTIFKLQHPNTENIISEGWIYYPIIPEKIALNLNSNDK
jgi:hypothetical protein